MDEQLLISFGIPQNVAHAYRLLVVRKSLRPAQYAKISGESRTNSYAILDRLTELGLATKTDEQKKFTYYPESPTALKQLLTKQLNQAETNLNKLERHLPTMLSSFQAGGEQPKISLARGKKELETMYTEQMKQKDKELYFIRSKADVPYFGLEKMQEIRMLAPQYKKRRFGITPIVSSLPSGRKGESSTNLKRTWIGGNDYPSSVEWAVCGNLIQAICLSGEGYGIAIEHPEIAESFRQILNLLTRHIKENPDYKKLPKFATE